MVTYDPRGMDWNNYCALMDELFGSQALGTVPEENWRDWVDALNGIGNFSQSGIPSQMQFNTWQEWAEQMVGIMDVRQA